MRLFQQIFALFVVKPFFKIFFNLRVFGLENIKNLTGPLLVISNHKFFIDSFAFGAALPLSSKLLPVSFMGEVRQFDDVKIRFLRKIGIVKLVYFLFGVCPAIRGQGLEAALEAPQKIIERGGVFFMHPEGKVFKEEGVGPFKRGAPALAKMTKVKILPVAFKIDKKGFRGNYRVKFGPVFTLPENLTVEQGADFMRNIIAGLYNELYAIKS